MADGDKIADRLCAISRRRYASEPQIPDVGWLLCSGSETCCDRRHTMSTGGSLDSRMHALSVFCTLYIRYRDRPCILWPQHDASEKLVKW